MTVAHSCLMATLETGGRFLVLEEISRRAVCELWSSWNRTAVAFFSLVVVQRVEMIHDQIRGQDLRAFLNTNDHLLPEIV